ncbi:MAG: hypothetical protein IPP35_05120 [Elusimicrobia bacterium]|nr:hypothetical protein [Elusimicrobiota bacterium]
MPLNLLRRITGGGLAAAYVFSNVVGAHAVETSLWKERREAADRQRASGELYARLPGVHPAAGPDAILPNLAPSFTQSENPSLVEILPPDAVETLGWLPAAVAAHGDIRRVHMAKKAGGPLVVHLQDVHENEEAQRNLAGLVGGLRAAGRADVVGLEGAVGAFHLEPYRSAPPDIARALAGEFVHLGYLTGPEAAAITAPQPTLLWGVEDRALYKKHVDAFSAAEKSRAVLARRVRELSETASGLRDGLYPARLRALDERRLAHAAKRESLSQYTSALWETPVAKGSFPNVARLVNLLSEEKRIDFKRVEAERQALIDALVRVVSPASLDRLVNESLRFREGRSPMDVTMISSRLLPGPRDPLVRLPLAERLHRLRAERRNHPTGEVAGRIE